jgi:hypothetical protein
LRAMAHYLSSLGHEAAASPKATPKAMIRPPGSKGLRRRRRSASLPAGARGHSRPPARSAMSKGPSPRLACAPRSQSTAPYAHPFPTT